jgi:hypothetical protein
MISSGFIPAISGANATISRDLSVGDLFIFLGLLNPFATSSNPVNGVGVTTVQQSEPPTSEVASTSSGGTVMLYSSSSTLVSLTAIMPVSGMNLQRKDQDLGYTSKYWNY